MSIYNLCPCPFTLLVSCFTVALVAVMSFVAWFLSFCKYTSVPCVASSVAQFVNSNSEMCLLDTLLECNLPFEKYSHLINCQMFRMVVLMSDVQGIVLCHGVRVERCADLFCPCSVVPESVTYVVAQSCNNCQK